MRHGVPEAQPSSRPATFVEERMFMSSRLAHEKPLNHIAFASWFEGEVDARRLTSACQALAERHEALRATFGLRTGKVHRIPGRGARLELEVRPAHNRADAAGFAVAFAARPFDIEAGPLARVALAVCPAGGGMVIVVVHHLISDARSMVRIFEDLDGFYTDPSYDSPRSGPAALENGATDLDADVSYWTRLLSGVPLHNNFAGAWRPGPRYAASEASAPLGADLAKRMDDFCRAERVTPFALGLAVWAGLLAKHSGAEQVAVALPLEGRSEQERLEVGLYVNTVLVPVLVSTHGLRQVASSVQRTLLTSLRHQRAPFGRVLDALPRAQERPRGAPFQVALNYGTDAKPTMRLGGVLGEPVEVSPDVSEFDLTLTLRPTASGVQAFVTYLTGCFESRWADKLPRHFAALMSHALSDPEMGMWALPMTLEDDAERVIAAGTGHRLDSGLDGLATRFRKVAQEHPNAVAVIDDDGPSTYEDLLRRAESVRLILNGLDLGPGGLVGLCSPRNRDAVAGMLGILAAGAAYVPLDPAHPRTRQTEMAQDAGVSTVLCHPSHIQGSWASLGIVPLPNMGVENVVDQEWADSSTNAAYVLYTSGSTGKPKGVRISQRAVVELSEGADYVDLGPGQVFLQLASHSFDASVIEVWGPLLSGGTVAIVTDVLEFMRAPSVVIERFGATAASLIGTQLHAIVDRDPRALSGLRTVLVGGETIDPARLARAAEVSPTTGWVHCYGPTEGCLFATTYVLDDPTTSHRRLPIGGPVAGTDVFVLDADRNVLPFGCAGDIFIAGPRTATEYLNRPAATADAFVDNSVTGHGTMYRTGDKGRFSDPGHLEFLGRADRQVKVRGHRVELQEVEAVLLACPGVGAATAELLATPEGDHITANVVANEGTSESEVRAWCGSRLPPYSVPSVVLVSHTLVMTVNGKLDTRALISAKEVDDRSRERSQARLDTPLERSVREAWQRITGRLPDRDDDFFEVGGTSLLALSLLDEVEVVAGARLPLSMVFEARTPTRIADWLRTHGTGPAAGSAVVSLNPRRTGPTVCCAYTVGGGVENYRPLATQLADTASVVGVVAPAFSSTSHTVQEQRVGSVLGLLEGSGSPRVLVGWSYGAVPAIQLAIASAPGFFDHVVLVDPPQSDGSSPSNPLPAAAAKPGAILSNSLSRAAEIERQLRAGLVSFEAIRLPQPSTVIFCADRPDLAPAVAAWEVADRRLIADEDHFAVVASGFTARVLRDVLA